MKLGILAFDIGDSIDITDIVKYAVKSEENHFYKFWLGEHYGQKIWCNPEPILPIILGMTESINVGAAGILINLHSTYRVVSSFKILNSFFPGRVDLGIAKGGTDENTLKHIYDLESYTQNPISTKIEKIYNYLNNEDGLIAEGISVPPYKYPVPEVWLLGLSYRGLADSLKFRFNFSRSLFHQSADKNYLRDELESYREKYYTLYNAMPNVNLSFSGILAKTESEATNLYKKSSFYNNDFIIPNLLGSQNLFHDKIMEYQEFFGLDEFIFLDLSGNFENKLDTLDTLSEIFKLSPLNINNHA